MLTSLAHTLTRGAVPSGNKWGSMHSLRAMGEDLFIFFLWEEKNRSNIENISQKNVMFLFSSVGFDNEALSSHTNNF